MDAIESKVQKLQELSRKQKKLNEFKQDIADILGNADMGEKKKIAEKMSKMEYESMDQARNLQFIVPNLVKELYDHNGPKGEFVIPKKEPITEPVVEPVVEPIVETKAETDEEEETEPKVSIFSKIAYKNHIVPGFKVENPNIEPVEVKESIEEKEPIIEPKKTQVNEPIVETGKQKEITLPDTKEDETIPANVTKTKKSFSRKKLRQRVKPKTRKEKIAIQQKKVDDIVAKKAELEKLLKETEENK